MTLGGACSGGSIAGLEFIHECKMTFADAKEFNCTVAKKKNKNRKNGNSQWEMKNKEVVEAYFFLRTVLGIHIKISVGRLIISELSFADVRFCVIVFFT